MNSSGIGARMKKPRSKPATVDSFDGSVQPAMHPEMRPLHKISPYPMNPRTHPPAQIDLLAKLLQKRGADQPIVVDEDGVILKGHGRRLAALAAGMEEFPVVVRRGLSEVEKSALRIEDNAVSLLSGWDQELIRAEVGVLKAEGYELSLLGFGEAQLVQFTTTPGPPAQFPAVGEDIPTDFCCPRCGHAWSGNPMAGKAKDERAAAKGNGRAKAGKTSR